MHGTDDMDGNGAMFRSVSGSDSASTESYPDTTSQPSGSTTPTTTSTIITTSAELKPATDSYPYQPQQDQTPCDLLTSDGSSTSTNPTNKHDQQPVLRRRGHFKSRLGCFNCKRRRVKCNEGRPICSSCRRLGLACEYPASAISTGGVGGGGGGGILTSPGLPRSPGTTTPSSSLSLDDLRFYHQFLTVAFPTLPLRRADIWSQCAAMSYHYDYLAHAILGLGASHTSQNSPADYRARALQHRVTAIELLNRQLVRPCSSAADADALFAAIVCLVAQSSLMPDTMIEYVTMTRGGNLVATTLLDYEASVFRDFTPDKHLGMLASMISEEPKDAVVIEGFRASLRELEPLCRTSYELQYWTSMYKSSTALLTSSLNAWKEFVSLFTMPSFFGHDDFSAFVKADNHVGQLLIIHMFLLDYLCGRFCLAPSDEPRCAGRKNVVIEWTRAMAKSLPAAYRKNIAWPREFCEGLAGRDARYLLSP